MKQAAASGASPLLLNGGTSRSSAIITGLSTVVEWYDFTLFLYFAAVLSRVFFGGGDDALSATLASFAAAYLMRPLGALAFGHFGDRYGRRRMMVWSMALMAVAMTMMAFLPTRSAVGPAAGWMLGGLRCLMAFSVGGEYNGVVAYLLESARPERRGLVTTLGSAASGLGGLLAVGVSALVAGSMTSAALEAWGWRVPFFLGAALAVLVGFARAYMDESPEFARQRDTNAVPRAPLRDALRDHPRAVANGFVISAIGSMTYYVGITYVPTFLEATHSATTERALLLATGAAFVATAITPVVGWLADRVGRRPVLLICCVGAAALPAGLFALMARGSMVGVVAGSFVLAALGGSFSAVGAVVTGEQFSGPGRLSGMALGVSSATALFGGLTPYLCQRLLEATGLPWVPGALIGLVAFAGLPWLWTISETHPCVALPTPKRGQV
jgi:MHS family proline/betaine transporter-like MFS transporter